MGMQGQIVPATDWNRLFQPHFLHQARAANSERISSSTAAGSLSVPAISSFTHWRKRDLMRCTSAFIACALRPTFSAVAA